MEPKPTDKEVSLSARLLNQLKLTLLVFLTYPFFEAFVLFPWVGGAAHTLNMSPGMTGAWTVLWHNCFGAAVFTSASTLLYGRMRWIQTSLITGTVLAASFRYKMSAPPPSPFPGFANENLYSLVLSAVAAGAVTALIRRWYLQSQ